MITIQHKSSLEVKHLDVREWLKYSLTEVKHWDILNISGIAKLFYNDRYMGLYEESQARQLLINNEYWMVCDLENFDYLNLRNRSLVQRIKAIFTSLGKPDAHTAISG